MKRKRHKTDEVVRKLREAEVLEGRGRTIAQICRQLEISEQTMHRWRKQFRGMGDNQIKRLKQLEEENRRLKKAVADLVLDKQIIEEVLRAPCVILFRCATGQWRLCGTDQCLGTAALVKRAEPRLTSGTVGAHCETQRRKLL